MNSVQLKLYITGDTPRSELAVANLKHLVKEKLTGLFECEMVIIDVLERADCAEEDKVMATPTLIKQFPAPARRVIGDLSDHDKVLNALGLQYAI